MNRRPAQLSPAEWAIAETLVSVFVYFAAFICLTNYSNISTLRLLSIAKVNVDRSS